METVSSRGSLDYLLGCTRTHVDKYTIIYTSFFIQTNEICIILSTEVLHYPRTSPGKNFIPRVFPGNEISPEIAPGDIP